MGTQHPRMPEPTDPCAKTVKRIVLFGRREARMGLDYHGFFASRNGDAQAVTETLAPRGYALAKRGF